MKIHFSQSIIVLLQQETVCLHQFSVLRKQCGANQLTKTIVFAALAYTQKFLRQTSTHPH